MAVEKISTSKQQKTEHLPVITWNKKHSLKQVASINMHTPEKKFFFAAATFEGL